MGQPRAGVMTHVAGVQASSAAYSFLPAHASLLWCRGGVELPQGQPQEWPAHPELQLRRLEYGVGVLYLHFTDEVTEA